LNFTRIVAESPLGLGAAGTLGEALEVAGGDGFDEGSPLGDGSADAGGLDDAAGLADGDGCAAGASC
jgi:hypothetical protein